MGWLLLIGVPVAAVLGAWRWLKTHPTGRCRWCKGSGRNPLSTKWRYGPCRHCDGTGRKEWKV